jgi:hypothetical protein
MSLDVVAHAILLLLGLILGHGHAHHVGLAAMAASSMDYACSKATA